MSDQFLFTKYIPIRSFVWLSYQQISILEKNVNKVIPNQLNFGSLLVVLFWFSLVLCFGFFSLTLLKNPHKPTKLSPQSGKLLDSPSSTPGTLINMVKVKTSIFRKWVECINQHLLQHVRAIQPTSASILMFPTE